MKITDMQGLLVDQLKDIYSAETQLLKALGKMAKFAHAEPLKQAFQEHRGETEHQIERLGTIAEKFGVKLTGKKCKAMEGLLEEGKEVMELEGNPALIDIALVAAAQRVEHYEISAYGTARMIAEHLNLPEVARVLDETLQEESRTDERLTQITQQHLVHQVQQGEMATMAGTGQNGGGRGRKSSGSR